PTGAVGAGSDVLESKAGGGAGREAAANRPVAGRTRPLLLRHGYRVAMTRTGPVFRYGNGGNIARAQFCNRRQSALMLRIHADGSTDTSRHGMATLYPSYHRGWTDDIYRRSLRAARLVQRAAVAATGAANNGLESRSDLTGFN